VTIAHYLAKLQQEDPIPYVVTVSYGSSEAVHHSPTSPEFQLKGDHRPEAERERLEVKSIAFDVSELSLRA